MSEAIGIGPNCIRAAIDLLTTIDQNMHTVWQGTLAAHSGFMFEIIAACRVTATGGNTTGLFATVDNVLSAKARMTWAYTGTGSPVQIASSAIWTDSGVTVACVGSAGGVVSVQFGVSGQSFAPTVNWYGELLQITVV